MSITDRMDAAIVMLGKRWPKRKRKAFYLCEADWNEFMATKPPYMQSEWGNNPVKLRTDPAFKDVPVRLSEANVSRFYNSSGSGCVI